MGQEKEYTGIISLGKTTPSYDLETEISISGDPGLVSDEDVLNASKDFIGEIDQVPPAYSAIRVNGERSYKKARKNQETKLEPRKVTIREFEITKISNPEVEFRLVCSKGTYVRSIAHDLGQKLGVGAHLASLRRTRIGDYDVTSAWKIDDFVEGFRNLQK